MWKVVKRDKRAVAFVRCDFFSGFERWVGGDYCNSISLRPEYKPAQYAWIANWEEGWAKVVQTFNFSFPACQKFTFYLAFAEAEEFCTLASVSAFSQVSYLKTKKSYF